MMPFCGFLFTFKKLNSFSSNFLNDFGQVFCELGNNVFWLLLCTSYRPVHKYISSFIAAVDCYGGGGEGKDTVRNSMTSWIGMKKSISSKNKSNLILMEHDEQKNF